MRPAGALLVVLALGHGAGAIGESGRASDLLWQLPASAGCRLRLVYSGGAVEVVTGGTVARLLGDAGRTRVHVAATAEEVLLTASAPAGAVSAEARVILEAPEACELYLNAGPGEIVVRGTRRGRLEAETTTGDMTLWVESPDGVAAELATSGEITVDFSVTIAYSPHREPAKRGRISVGTRASTVRLTSLQGAIRVLRLRPGPFENDSPETGVEP